MLMAMRVQVLRIAERIRPQARRRGIGQKVLMIVRSRRRRIHRIDA